MKNIKIEDFNFNDSTLKGFDLINYYSGFFSIFQIEENRKVIKYIENEKVIGALVFGIKPNYINLEALEVSEKKRGIGKELVDSLKDHAKDNHIEEIFTEAICDTIPFYLKQGFFTLEPNSAVVKMAFLFDNPINKSQLSLNLGI